MTHPYAKGICFGYGFSLGGWGSRQNWSNFSGEVCGNCADYITKKLEPVFTELYINRNTKKFKINWQEKISLKIARFIGSYINLSKEKNKGETKCK